MKLSTFLTRVSLTATLGALLFINAQGCTAIVDSKIKGTGFGETCHTNDDCHAGSCVDSVCTTACTSSADCPAPTTCAFRKDASGAVIRDGNPNFCAAPLKAGFMYIGVLEDQVRAWSPASHAMWAIWGIVQARDDIEAAVEEPEFDYIGYARCRMEGFRRELRALGIL